MAFIGIDVGGQSIKAGIISGEGKIIFKEVCLTEAHKGREAVISNIEKVVRILQAKHERIEAMGIGVPGIIDEKGFITFTPNIPLSGMNLDKELRQFFTGRICYGNDADNFALAQMHFGPGKGVKNFLTLTLGTGVGSGVVIDGKIFSNKGAPEFGHTTIKFDAPSMKDVVNDGSVESFLGRKSFHNLSPLEAYKLATQNDKQALKTFEEYGRYLGIALSNAINIFNPEIIILGGQLSNAFDFFRLSMAEEIKKRAIFKTKIVKNKIRDAGLVGAAILAF